MDSLFLSSKKLKRILIINNINNTNNINNINNDSDQRKELKERMATMVKEKAYKGPKQKGGGTTNIQKLKKKPLMMVRPKKNKMQQNAIDSVKQKIKKIKNQLGHVRNAKEFKRKKEHKKK